MTPFYNLTCFKIDINLTKFDQAWAFSGSSLNLSLLVGLFLRKHFPFFSSLSFFFMKVQYMPPFELYRSTFQTSTLLCMWLTSLIMLIVGPICWQISLSRVNFDSQFDIMILLGLINAMTVREDSVHGKQVVYAHRCCLCKLIVVYAYT